MKGHCLLTVACLSSEINNSRGLINQALWGTLAVHIMCNGIMEIGKKRYDIFATGCADLVLHFFRFDAIVDYVAFS